MKQEIKAVFYISDETDKKSPLYLSSQGDDWMINAAVAGCLTKDDINTHLFSSEEDAKKCYDLLN